MYIYWKLSLLYQKKGSLIFKILTYIKINLEELTIQGIRKIVDKSSVFLNEIGEFAPFGLIYKNNKWIDIATYDDSMNSTIMRNFLMSTISQDLQEENCLFGAVCVDVRIEDIGDTIIIYNSTKSDEWYELIYKYITTENGEKIIEESPVD